MEKRKENKKKYNAEYKKINLKRIPLDMRLQEYEAMKEHIEETGETVNGFIKRAIKETISNDVCTTVSLLTRL